MQAFRDIITFLAAHDALRNQTFVFAFGSMVSLLISLVSNERRSSGRLIAGSIFGGVGAVLAFRAYNGWLWELAVAASALGAERIALGVRRITDDFSRSPWSTVKRLLALATAIFGALKNIKIEDEAPPPDPGGEYSDEIDLPER